jgi:hypothetical protein
MAPIAPRHIRNELAAVLLLLVALLIAYKVTFVDLLISPDGEMGHDYRFFLPALLSGYFWYQTNGPAHIPWFSPSQCGGLPFFGDLQVPYYSAPQFLSLVLPPSAAVAATFLLFAAIGFLGTYGLLRSAFRVTPWPSAAGATFFMFNGFFASRMLIGHLTYHAFMLTPLLAWILLTMPKRNGGDRSWIRICGHVAAGSLIAGYIVHAGMANIAVVPLVAIAMVLVLHAAVFGWRPQPWAAGVLCGAGALAVAAVKLVPSVAFLSRFPRDLYTLPGFGDPLDTLKAAFSSLYLSVSANWAAARLENVSWWLTKHEWEYGVTIVPLVLLVFGLVLRWRKPRHFAGLSLGRSLACAAFVLLGLVPLALNTYGESWNAFLKSLPVIGQSSSHVRMFAVYILPAIIAPALLLDQAAKALPKGSLPRISFVAIAAVVTLNAVSDRSYYAKSRTYDARALDLAYFEARDRGEVPAVTQIVADSGLQRGDPGWKPRSNAFTEGGSYLNCYQPTFGYRLETFPRKSLAAGLISAIRDGVFNLKNPSCYVFPAENGCAPGDHFTLEQRAALDNFAAYRPFPFKMPWYQTAATWVSISGLCAALAALVAWLMVAIRPRNDPA